VKAGNEIDMVIRFNYRLKFFWLGSYCYQLGHNSVAIYPTMLFGRLLLGRRVRRNAGKEDLGTVDVVFVSSE